MRLQLTVMMVLGLLAQALPLAAAEVGTGTATMGPSMCARFALSAPAQSPGSGAGASAAGWPDAARVEQEVGDCTGPKTVCVRPVDGGGNLPVWVTERYEILVNTLLQGWYLVEVCAAHLDLVPLADV